MTAGIAAVAAVAGIAVFTGAAPAAAGTNGQQVIVATHYSDKISICGGNQNGDYTCTGVNTPDGYTHVPGWYWRGWIRITGTQLDSGKPGGTIRVADCWVPKEQDGDWTYCYTYDRL
ncbi:hypothetical protein ABZ079_26960 [Streptomyces sp. NPDC006314]|uniref:hypothetical protein n=1 Tax=Streptomyces sp. NPDC006314 TaxID=3154475 RepID=UPI0033AD2F8A